ncbi:hypothetical protein Golob_014258 [Gossypium lobatum]|uniref:Uncharacterized protein n=1 Tax=Gossypium lobatum TaxID=34289 RepID=A0A7J8LRY8_9ROSI|nr:hypothetical protein [Gossypium lobatum]
MFQKDIWLFTSVRSFGGLSSLRVTLPIPFSRFCWKKPMRNSDTITMVDSRSRVRSRHSSISSSA